MAPEILAGACPHLRAPVSQPVLPGAARSPRRGLGAAGLWWPSPPPPRSTECHPTLPAGPVPGERGPAPAAGAGESLGQGHGGCTGLRPLWTPTTKAATRRRIQRLGWVPALCLALCLGLRTQAGQVETPTGDRRQCPEWEMHWVLCSLCWQLWGARGVSKRGPLHAIQGLMDEEMGWVSRQNSVCRGWEHWECWKPRPLAVQGRARMGGMVLGAPLLQGARPQAQVWWQGWGGAWGSMIRGPRLPPSGRVPLLPALGGLCIYPG